MLEATALNIEGAQGIQRGGAVLDEPGILVSINSQSCQSNDHLRNGLAAGAVNACVRAVSRLHFRQRIDCIVDGFLDLCIGLIVGCQSLERHAGDIRIGSRSSQRPATVCKLCIQNDLNQRRTGYITIGNRVVTGIEGQQCPNGTVDALLLDVFHTVQTLQQIMSANIGHILADGSQCQNQSGILRRLCLVEPFILVDILLNILHSQVIPGLHILDLPTGADQTNDHPLAADTAHTGHSQIL